MKKIILFLFIATNIQIFAQGKLISYEKVDSLNFTQLKAIWKDLSLPQLITSIKNEVDIYELYYNTQLPSGKEVVATGLYYVPKGVQLFPIMQYNHGTVTRNRTSYDYNGESTICKIFAADSYAVAWQDYIGLGKAEGFHPYQHAETAGQSGVDLLKAIKEINQDLGLITNNELFITGYSQGGYSTMAVHKMIEEKYATVFNVTASSPMSGAYDMAGVQSKVMEIEYTQPHYLPYLLYGYQELYNIIDGEFEQIFVAPYDSIIPLYFDKQHSVNEINDILPSIPMDMIDPLYADEFRNNPDFLFRKVLEENNLYKWIPQAPVQFCYCKSDEEVTYENAIVAYDWMKKNGAKNIIKRNVGNTFSHHDCASYAAMYTKFYFDSFRNGAKNGTRGPIMKNILVGIVKGIK